MEDFILIGVGAFVFVTVFLVIVLISCCCAKAHKKCFWKASADKYEIKTPEKSIEIESSQSSAQRSTTKKAPTSVDIQLPLHLDDENGATNKLDDS